MTTNSKRQSEVKPLRSMSSDRPWLWAEKAALRKIRQLYSESGRANVALAVYLGLVEASSDFQKNPFSAPVEEIAKRSGLTPKTVHTVLPVLEQSGIITINRRRIPGLMLKAPSEYGLLQVEPMTPEVTSMLPPVLSMTPDAEQTLKLENQRILEGISEGILKKEAPSALLFPESFSSDGAKEKFAEWMKYRRKLKKAGDWDSLFQRQLDRFSKFTEAEAIEAIDSSMANGYTGLFPKTLTPKSQPKKSNDEKYAAGY